MLVLPGMDKPEMSTELSNEEINKLLAPLLHPEWQPETIEANATFYSSHKTHQAPVPNSITPEGMVRLMRRWPEWAKNFPNYIRVLEILRSAHSYDPVRAFCEAAALAIREKNK